VVLSVELTERGPVVRLESASIQIVAAGEVAVDCERFTVHARADASIEASEVNVRTVRGDVTVRSRRDVYLGSGVLPGARGRGETPEDRSSPRGGR
jgi:hypothetical protein